MKSSTEFCSLIGEIFAPLGQVVVRSMFGGAGAFCDGVMFALVADDVLYLRVDDQNRPDFEAQGLSQFIYESPSKKMPMPYYEAHPSIFDSPELATLWGSAALAAAQRNKPTKRKR